MFVFGCCGPRSVCCYCCGSQGSGTVFVIWTGNVCHRLPTTTPQSHHPTGTQMLSFPFFISSLFNSGGFSHRHSFLFKLWESCLGRSLFLMDFISCSLPSLSPSFPSPQSDCLFHYGIISRGWDFPSPPSFF